jgi:hypothetical protein
MLAGIRSDRQRDSEEGDGQRTKSHDGGSTSLLGDLCLFNIHDIHDDTIGSVAILSIVRQTDVDSRIDHRKYNNKLTLP